MLDTKGLLFTLKFFAFLFAVVFIVRFSADTVVENAFAPEFYQAQVAYLMPTLPPDEIKLGFVGDIMMDRDVEKKILKEGGGDFRFPFLNIADTLQKYDFLFGNLEGPISDKGRNVGSIYSFRMDPKAADALKFAGFDILSVTNNHSGDWGRAAFSDTLERLSEAGILSVGGTHEPEIIVLENTKIAFLAFSDFPGPAAITNPEKIRESIAKASQEADIVIVSFHFGEEYKKEASTRQKKLSYLAVDSGANLVVGHHPHVAEPIEQYKNSYIAYSLGNFIFDQGFSEETMKGILLEVTLKNKKISKVLPRKIQLNENFQPALAKEL